MRSLPLLPLALVVVCGCGSSPQQLRARAASDLNCDAQKLQVKEVRYEVYEVSGCNRTETYVLDDGESWIKESESPKTMVEGP